VRARGSRPEFVEGSVAQEARNMMVKIREGRADGKAIMYRQNYGKIISTASQLAYRGYPQVAHYAAAKAAYDRRAYSASLTFVIQLNRLGQRATEVNATNAAEANHCPPRRCGRTGKLDVRLKRSQAPRS
jgi:NAD(P)-dependent dehydrogenase (short-subunit alcohol dehydrogenase family)